MVCSSVSCARRSRRGQGPLFSLSVVLSDRCSPSGGKGAGDLSARFYLGRLPGQEEIHKSYSASEPRGDYLTRARRQRLKPLSTPTFLTHRVFHLQSPGRPSPSHTSPRRPKNRRPSGNGSMVPYLLVFPLATVIGPTSRTRKNPPFSRPRRSHCCRVYPLSRRWPREAVM